MLPIQPLLPLTNLPHFSLQVPQSSKQNTLFCTINEGADSRTYDPWKDHGLCPNDPVVYVNF